ncbi:DUF1156 domain-containing protein [Micromonospora coxensis]|uniref:DUF1156 domain-containing protein n=1 Tax=Micromonospora coxensis TaxID=356852 RepID=UPI003433CEB5
MTVLSLIDQWFPAEQIGAESLRERGSAKAFPPVNFLHIWWARRPLSASRAATLGSLLPAWPSAEGAATDAAQSRVREGLARHFTSETAYHSWFLKVVGIPAGKNPAAARAQILAAVASGERTKGNAYGYDRAFTSSPSSSDVELIRHLVGLRWNSDGGAAPVVLDPFAGGGSIPFEAMRLGCDVIANELNPVASAVLQGTLGVVHDFGPELSDDIRRWGGEWARCVKDELAPFFPSQDRESVASYVWAFSVPCPVTGRPTPLAPNFWLAQVNDPGKQVAVKLNVHVAAGSLTPEIVTGADAERYGPKSTYKGGVAESVWAPGVTFSGDYIREQAQKGKGSYFLLAVVQAGAGSGRTFRAPNNADLKAIELAAQELERRRPKWELDDLIPNELIGRGQETERMADLGVLRWSDAFMPRQLLANVIILEQLLCIQPKIEHELGERRAKAVALHLAYALDRCLDYNSRYSFWDKNFVKLQHTFDRHDFAFSWSSAEFEAARSLVPWAVENSARNHVNLSKLVHGGAVTLDGSKPADLGRPRVLRGSATGVPLADESVDAVVTDPPYYDNVMYAELSDFFYVWLKRSLRDVWPEFCDLVVTDKDLEAVANPSLFADVATHSGPGKKKQGSRTAAELASRRYEELLTASFREAARVLKPSGVMNVMFTHKRVDAWDTLGAALLNAGFAITSSWPISTESENSLHQAKKNSAQSTILLNCHKRGSTSAAYWTDIRRAVEQAAVDAVQRFSKHGLRGVDLTLATYGPVLAVLSRNWPVFTGELDNNGQPEVLRPDVALDLAREKVAALKKRGLLGGKDVEFDRVTDWWLLAWSDFQAAEFPAGEALKLSLATHLDLDTLSKKHKLIKTASGKATLLTPAQRRTAKGLDVDAATYPSMVDALHALMLIYEEDGARAAQSWLSRRDLTDDIRFKELVRAALNAIPRRKQKGSFVRPEARVLDSLRASFFDDVPLPPEPDSLAPAPHPVLF